MMILIMQYVTFTSLSSSYLFFRLHLVANHLIWVFYVIFFPFKLENYTFYIYIFTSWKKILLYFISHFLEFSPNSSLLRIFFGGVGCRTKVTWNCFIEIVSNISQCPRVGNINFGL